MIPKDPTSILPKNIRLALVISQGLSNILNENLMKHIVLALLCIVSGFSSFAQGYSVNSIIPEIKPASSENHTELKDKTIPFNLMGGLIMVQTEINGKASSCIFDTGAPSIVINKDQELMEHPNGTAVGVTGRMKIKSTIVRDFELGGMKKRNIEALEIDLKHLERLKRQPINGIIGVDAYNDEELLIDYQKQEIKVLPRRHRKKFENKKVLVSVPFYMERQLPVIKVKIGKRNFFFGVDTGAEVNVMDSRCMKRLKKCKVEMVGEKTLAGIDQTKNNGKTAKLDAIKIKKQKFENLEVVFMDLSKFNRSHGFQLDGILGFPFLKENLISFDFRGSKLNFWKETIMVK